MDDLEGLDEQIRLFCLLKVLRIWKAGFEDDFGRLRYLKTFFQDYFCVTEAEKVKKADKLLKLLVDTGLDKRTIVSGIAKHYSAEEVIGKQVTVLMNLPPRTIRGVDSQGMILMAENEKGELSFVSSEKDFDAGFGIH